jgi:hypothetical protein
MRQPRSDENTIKSHNAPCPFSADLADDQVAELGDDRFLETSGVGGLKESGAAQPDSASCLNKAGLKCRFSPVKLNPACGVAAGCGRPLRRAADAMSPRAATAGPGRMGADRLPRLIAGRQALSLIRVDAW